MLSQSVSACCDEEVMCHATLSHATADVHLLLHLQQQLTRARDAETESADVEIAPLVEGLDTRGRRKVDLPRVRREGDLVAEGRPRASGSEGAARLR